MKKLEGVQEGWVCAVLYNNSVFAGMFPGI